MAEEKTKVPLLVQASISHYVARRDKAIAELDLCLNKATASESKDSMVDKINGLFEELYISNGILKTIEETINIEKEISKNQ
jgi:hypothetical protein